MFGEKFKIEIPKIKKYESKEELLKSFLNKNVTEQTFYAIKHSLLGYYHDLVASGASESIPCEDSIRAEIFATFPDFHKIGGKI